MGKGAGLQGVRVTVPTKATRKSSTFSFRRLRPNRDLFNNTVSTELCRKMTESPVGHGNNSTVIRSCRRKIPRVRPTQCVVEINVRTLLFIAHYRGARISKTSFSQRVTR